MKTISTKLPLALAVAGLSICTSVIAEEFTLEEVLVTAQKREQSLQDVPIAVTAVSADQLKQQGVSTLSDISSSTPGFTLTETQSEEQTISMRGIGSTDFGYSSDESIPVYLDGVYMGNGASIIGDLMDISQVEILKGPQGTLFGRNAIGGAVSVKTASPSDELEGSLNIGAGKHDLRTLKGMINIPLIEDELAMRINVGKRDRDGWQKNAVTGERDGFEQDRWNSRVKFLWTPSDELSIQFTSDWQRELDHSGYPNLIDPTLAGLVSSEAFDVGGSNASAGNLFLDLNDLSTAGDPGTTDPIDSGLNRKVRGNALNITWDINDNLTLTSISSYRELKSAISYDLDGTEFMALHVRSFLETEEYSQEFRISGSTDTLDWFVGLSGYRQDTRGETRDDFGATLASTAGYGSFEITEAVIADAKAESYAVFGDAIWSLTDSTNLTLGLRFSYDAKSQDLLNDQPGLIFPGTGQLLGANGLPDPGRASSHDNWDNVSGRIVIDHQLAEDTLIFAGVSQGYKSGGFSSFPTVDTDPLSPTFGAVPFESTEPFDEETVINYEAGIKSTLLDQRLRVNASTFFYQFEDLQVQAVQNGIARTANAGEAEGYGIDFDASFLATENLMLALSLSWLNAEYTKEVDLGGGSTINKGQDLAYSPKWSGNLSLDYRLPFDSGDELRTHINYAYTAERSHSNSNRDSLFIEESSAVLNARLSWISADEHWEVAMWGTNLTDEETINSVIDSASDFGFITAYRGEPRMYGLDVGYSF